MDPNVRKTVLRMIPYGLYVLTAERADGTVAAATVNWVTQASFQPPLLAVGVKADSQAHAVIKASGAFALNVLGKGQQALAYTFFKPAERQGATISGEPVRAGATGRADPRQRARVRRVPARRDAGARRSLDLRRRGRGGGARRGARRAAGRRHPVAPGAGRQGLLRRVARRAPAGGAPASTC